MMETKKILCTADQLREIATGLGIAPAVAEDLIQQLPKQEPPNPYPFAGCGAWC